MLKKLMAPLLLGVAGCAVLISLTVWQVERMAWKDDLIEQTKNAMDAEPSTIDAIDWSMLAEIESGTPFVLSGKLLNRYTDKLSGAGYNRILAFDTGDHVIMVEVGFIDQFKKNNEFTVPQKTISIKGRSYAPDGNGTLDAQKNVWVGYNISELADQLDAEPFLLIANESPIDGIADVPFTIDFPNNHLQYAITWALLTLVWAGMTVYWGYSKIRTRKTG